MFFPAMISLDISLFGMSRNAPLWGSVSWHPKKLLRRRLFRHEICGVLILSVETNFSVCNTIQLW